MAAHTRNVRGATKKMMYAGVGMARCDERQNRPAVRVKMEDQWRPNGKAGHATVKGSVEGAVEKKLSKALAEYEGTSTNEATPEELSAAVVEELSRRDMTVAKTLLVKSRRVEAEATLVKERERWRRKRQKRLDDAQERRERRKEREELATAMASDGTMSTVMSMSGKGGHAETSNTVGDTCSERD
ncbi:uncharacterized protein KRP23_11420 [Phytophthora ramorum]|uniref:uncharacterized protein n=1 Tax=Phytophthora ramorum TaxID=164328 RepID=UPI0030A0B888|nr:hypothetical protein KRP23_11420 [Phytophthora ramorum]